MNICRPVRCVSPTLTASIAAGIHTIWGVWYIVVHHYATWHTNTTGCY